jgi:hypothetical protein
VAVPELGNRNGFRNESCPLIRALHEAGLADTGTQTLSQVLAANGVNPAADGWSYLAAVTGISADGNKIVGYGYRNGGVEAFVAQIPSIPEPASLGLLMFATGLTLARRRRW